MKLFISRWGDFKTGEISDEIQRTQNNFPTVHIN